MNNALLSQKNTHDWHREDIKAALHKCGSSFADIARKHKKSPSTVQSVLDKPYPKWERAVAQAIGVAPEEIWAKRYAERNLKSKSSLHG